MAKAQICDGELQNLEDQGDESSKSKEKASKGKIAGAFRAARNPSKQNNNESIEDMLIKAGIKKGGLGGPKSAFTHQTDFTQVTCPLAHTADSECFPGEANDWG